jgi:hypothetical protein
MSTSVCVKNISLWEKSELVRVKPFKVVDLEKKIFFTRWNVLFYVLKCTFVCVKASNFWLLVCLNSWKNEKSPNFVRILIFCAVVQNMHELHLIFVIVIVGEGSWIFNLFLTKNCLYSFSFLCWSLSFKKVGYVLPHQTSSLPIRGAACLPKPNNSAAHVKDIEAAKEKNY